MIHREELTIETRGRATYEITKKIQQIVERSGLMEVVNQLSGAASSCSR